MLPIILHNGSKTAGVACRLQGWQDSHRRIHVSLSTRAAPRAAEPFAGACVRRKRGGPLPPQGEEAMSKRLTASEARRVRATESARRRQTRRAERPRPSARKAPRPLRSAQRARCLRRRLHRRHEGPQVAPDHRATGLPMLENLTHRGAVGADPLVGDGAGMLAQIPDASSARRWPTLGFELPPPGHYGVGHLFMPRDAALARPYRRRSSRGRAAKGSRCSASATCRSTIRRCRRRRHIAASEPFHRQVFIGRGADDRARTTTSSAGSSSCARSSRTRIYDETQRRDNGFYIVSLSARTIVYKGMFLAYQVGAYYKRPARPALRDARWRWSTSASRPTPSRRGSSRIPTGWSPTMARSTRCAATSTGWRRGRRRSILAAVRQRHLEAVADLLRRPVRHRLLRQRARIPVPGRLRAGARHDDADPGSLGRQQADG